MSKQITSEEGLDFGYWSANEFEGYYIHFNPYSKGDPQPEFCQGIVHPQSCDTCAMQYAWREAQEEGAGIIDLGGGYVDFGSFEVTRDAFPTTAPSWLSTEPGSINVSDRQGNKAHLPKTSAERKDVPITTGVLDYFPDAIVAVAKLSKVGNEQHNPGEPLHWARDKSTDHADCITRHLLDRGTVDTDGIRHSAKVAWRALALLQTEIEEEAKASKPS